MVEHLTNFEKKEKGCVHPKHYVAYLRSTGLQPAELHLRQLAFAAIAEKNTVKQRRFTHFPATTFNISTTNSNETPRPAAQEDEVQHPSQTA